MFAAHNFIGAYTTVEEEPIRGPATVVAGQVSSTQRLPTDSLGTFALTLNNLVVGSLVRVAYAGSGGTVDQFTATASTMTTNVGAYSPGSALNNLRVKVRKASTPPTYIPWETLTTAFVGSQSIFVSQIPDE